ncbi:MULTISPECIES: bile acid:sodium symporter family protein [Rhizobium]|jgi:sodium/bile acid cotransporter 7|uniref:Solute carrier family 10 (Sodium/bile acid cotransporter), member 7 n=1 Tax=Rhizobium lusitanum TaxID=293958 RepID=A0A1C3UVV3_9HYPH|nr:bile acid:sodium symporter family protein [Rhizobium lusitanum]SCB19591.1 solute carrier family 10 (sodium/bile acid cotransporter), member 7 [Rhizobium lusitanum]
MRRFLPDTFTMLLVLTVATASFLPVHGASAHYFGIATNFAIGLLFFLHGARLSRDVVIAGLLHWRLHLVILLTTFGIFPLLVLAIGQVVPNSILPVSLYTGMLFLSVLPSTVQSSIAFTSIAGGNVPAAICSASASNIFGMFLTPLLVGLLFSVGGQGGFSWDVLWQIMLQLLAPFIAGQLLQPWIGDWIRSKKKILMPVDRGSILMVVYSAFSEAVVEGLWHTFSVLDIATVIVANMLLLTTVLCITMFGSRALGFSKADEITITFCGSKKSLASGVPMANVIFAGQGIGAIVLPLMLFHQIQLMTCAFLAQKYADAAKRRETAKAEATGATNAA